MKKKGKEVSEVQIINLNFFIKTYNGLNRLIVSTKQRLQSVPGDQRIDSLLKTNDEGEGFETVKGRLVRAIEKELSAWDIWETWLKDVPGIGPWLAGELIIMYYYRFIAICKECGGDLVKEEKNGKKTLVCIACGKVAKRSKKGADDGGLLQYRIEEKDFETISKWWAYLGRHTVDGIMPKRKSGSKPDPVMKINNWSTPGRTVTFHVGEQFNRQKEDHPYKAILLERKAKHARNHPDWTKGHIHNAARNEAVKIFLSHFWVVARTISGKPVSQPYIGAIKGHTNITEPFYW